MFRGATLFEYPDVLSVTTIRNKLTEANRIENKIDDKNTGRERNLSTRLRDVGVRNGRVVGVVDYYFQARISRQVEYADIYETYAFIISPDDNILVILGASAHADQVRNQIAKCLYPNEFREVQHFESMTITPEAMERIALTIRDGHERNWCDRPRFTHTPGNRTEFAFHDYSFGPGNCVMDTATFRNEIAYCIGFSPIIKFRTCPHLDPHETRISKTIRLKYEGQISTSRSYEFEYWEYFIFDLVLRVVNDT